jgi:hypothetical protein
MSIIYLSEHKTLVWTVEEFLSKKSISRVEPEVPLLRQVFSLHGICIIWVKPVKGTRIGLRYCNIIIKGNMINQDEEGTCT